VAGNGSPIIFTSAQARDLSRPGVFRTDCASVAIAYPHPMQEVLVSSLRTRSSVPAAPQISPRIPRDQTLDTST
jgi:hypothetical protein